MKRERTGSIPIGDISPGEEHWISFQSRTGEDFVRYHYRCKTGNLFSIIAPDLNLARQKRDFWLVENRLKNSQQVT